MMGNSSIPNELVYGAAETLQLAAISWALGLPLGTALAVAARTWRPVGALLRVVGVGIVITPALAILFWLHYPLQSVLDVVWMPASTTLIFLTTYVAVCTGDILSSEMVKLEFDLAETALVLGVSFREFFVRVLFQGSVRQGLPRLLSLMIVTIHMTMFASLIGVEELFRVTQRLNAQYLRPVELYTAMSVAYVLLCVPLHFLAMIMRKRLAAGGQAA